MNWLKQIQKTFYLCKLTRGEHESVLKLIAAVKLARKTLENAHQNAVASGGSLPSGTLADMRHTIARLHDGAVLVSSKDRVT